MIGTLIGSQLAVSKHVGRAVTSNVTCLCNKSTLSRPNATDTCLGVYREQRKLAIWLVENARLQSDHFGHFEAGFLAINRLLVNFFLLAR